MKYLKYFNNDSDYRAFIGVEFLKPNVSFVKENNFVGYHPHITQGVYEPGMGYATYYTTRDGASVQLFNHVHLSEIVEMRVDGEYITPTDGYTFEKAGYHNVAMRLSDDVTDMSFMFNHCTSLTSLDLSNWDTSNVTNMQYMFWGCNSLTSIEGISNWDTSNVTDIGNMFYGCSKLTSLDDLSNWDVSNVNTVDNIFYDCRSLTSIDLSNWDFSNVSMMGRLFYDCISLVELRMGGAMYGFGDSEMFGNVETNGTFYYNSEYDYSEIFAALPSTWTAIPCTLVDGVLIPDE